MRELSVTFTTDLIRDYASASGDRNPIHLDEEFARSVGLPGVIAHGMLQMGFLARVAGPPERLRRLSCRFTGMVRPGDTVLFRAEDADEPPVSLRISAATPDGRPVLTRAVAELD